MRISPEISDSIELKFSQLARQMNASGQDIISFGLGEPDFATPPSIVDAATAAMKDGYTRYSNPFGLLELREKISAELNRQNGIDAAPEEIIVTPGAKMALSLALGALLTPGDEIINITPCYPSYIPQIKIAEPDCVLHNIDLTKSLNLDFEKIRAQFNPKTKAILLNFPHNPTGKMLRGKDLELLVDLVADTDCFVISDEIYERLNFSGVPHISPGSHKKLSHQTITINGFSKAFSMTGWRIGYLVIPDQNIRQSVSKLQQHLNTNTTTFIQKAACVAFDLPSDFLDDYNARLDTNNQKLVKMAHSNPLLNLATSDGGLFSFLEISDSRLTSDEFANKLLAQEGVAATPGIIFGKNWDSHIRISLAIDSDLFAEGITRLDRFASSLDQ
jgi:aspartate aminotransferase